MHNEQKRILTHFKYVHSCSIYLYEDANDLSRFLTLSLSFTLSLRMMMANKMNNFQHICAQSNCDVWLEWSYLCVILCHEIEWDRINVQLYSHVPFFFEPREKYGCSAKYLMVSNIDPKIQQIYSCCSLNGYRYILSDFQSTWFF